MQIELTGWPTLLPAIGPFAFRVTPAGLLEWLAARRSSLAPDLRVAVDAAQPGARADATRRRRPAGDHVSGDAAFATDIDWLIDNLRWDLQDDLARIVGDGPARQLARVGGWSPSVRGAGLREAARTPATCAARWRRRRAAGRAARR